MARWRKRQVTRHLFAGSVGLCQKRDGTPAGATARASGRYERVAASRKDFRRDRARLGAIGSAD
ncbi:MAG: hypothetical protein ACLQIQ_12595 [Beijerinckiaceae bacterium]